MQSDYLSVRKAGFFKERLIAEHLNCLSAKDRAKIESYYRPMAVALIARDDRSHDPVPADWKAAAFVHRPGYQKRVHRLPGRAARRPGHPLPAERRVPQGRRGCRQAIAGFRPSAPHQRLRCPSQGGAHLRVELQRALLLVPAAHQHRPHAVLHLVLAVRDARHSAGNGRRADHRKPRRGLEALLCAALQRRLLPGQAGGNGAGQISHPDRGEKEPLLGRQPGAVRPARARQGPQHARPSGEHEMGAHHHRGREKGGHAGPDVSGTGAALPRRFAARGLDGPHAGQTGAGAGAVQDAGREREQTQLLHLSSTTTRRSRPA